MNSSVRTGAYDMVHCHSVGGGGVLLALVACLMAGISTPASGQNVQLEEIVVTARQREETLRDVPVAVSAFSAADLERMNVTSNEDLLGRVPNLFISGSAFFGSWTNFTIRGVGAHTPLEPAVAVFLDGVYMPSLGWDLSFLDTERVEVLRGPQGTLFGRNTQAGALNIVSRKPGQEVYGKLRFEVDDFETVSVSGNLGGPLSDKVSVSVAGVGYQTDGYVRNVTLGDDLLARSKFGGRAQFIIQASDRLTAVLSADGISEEGGFYGQGQPLDGTTKELPPWQVRYDVKHHEIMDNYGFSMNLNYEFDEAQLTSISGYRILNWAGLSDIDGVDTPDRDGLPSVIVPLLAGRNFPVPDQNYLFQTRDQSILSQEVRLASLNSGSLNWLLGAYVFSEDNDSHRNFAVPDSLVFASPNNIIDNEVDQKRTGYSVFGQASYLITEHLELTAGARYAHEKIEQDLTMIFDVGDGFLADNYTANPSNSYEDVSPMVSLKYNINENVMTYATASKGFKGGGYNPSAPTDPEANFAFDAETSWMYEVGTKSEFFDNRLTADVALYWADVKDMQVSISRINAGGVISTGIANAAAARSRGVEFEFAALPTPELRFSGALSYTDSIYQDYINDAGVDLSKEPIEDTPDWIGNLAGEYTIDVANELDLTLGATYRYVGNSRTGNGTPSTPHHEVDSYDQVDLRASLGSDIWELTLYAENVFNSYNVIWKGGFITFYRGADEAFGQRANPPRRVGLTGTYRF